MEIVEAALSERIENLDSRVGEILAILSPDRRSPTLYVSQFEIETSIDHELKELRLRHELFPKVAQKQIAWELLLLAYQHTIQRKLISVSGLVDSTHAPSSTALRHLYVLEVAGMLLSEDDPLDARRRWITVSENVRRLMLRYFTDLVR